LEYRQKDILGRYRSRGWYWGTDFPICWQGTSVWCRRRSRCCGWSGLVAIDPRPLLSR